jgi:cell division protein FtsZ
MIEIQNNTKNNMPKIAVVGIGGGGCNAISRMTGTSGENVTYIAVNTDLQSLEDTHADIHLQIGQKLTLGFGAGADPSIGESSANESEEEIETLLKDYHMVILTCGLGGGTGTGAIPAIAKICRSLQILTIAVVTLPFSFENTPRMICADSGLDKLKNNVDTLLVIPNDKLLAISEKTFYLDDAFVLADTILKYTIEGITNIPLKFLLKRHGILIACIVRNNRVIIPYGNDEIRSGDTVIVVTAQGQMKNIKDILR